MMTFTALQSCTNNEFEGFGIKNHDTEASASKIFTLGSGEAKKLAFNMLNPTEKASIWQTKFERELLSSRYSEAQKMLIEELMEYSNQAFFDNKPTIEEERITTMWLDKAQKAFDPKVLLSLAFTLDNGVYALAVNEEPNCICNIGSMFTCPKFSASLDGVSMSWGECFSNPSRPQCKPTGSGCGFLMRYSCNGNDCEAS